MQWTVPQQAGEAVARADTSFCRVDWKTKLKSRRARKSGLEQTEAATSGFVFEFPLGLAVASAMQAEHH